MRNTKIIKIDDTEITLKELRVRDIYALFKAGEDTPLLSRVDDLLVRGSDLEREKMMDMTPTDLNKLWEGFKDVNQSFLDMGDRLGLSEMVKQIMENVQKSLLDVPAFLLQPDMEAESGSMDGHSS